MYHLIMALARSIRPWTKNIKPDNYPYLCMSGLCYVFSDISFSPIFLNFVVVIIGGVGWLRNGAFFLLAHIAGR